MFKWYGTLGILIILFTEANFFFRVEPFIYYAFPMLWFSFILVVDALVFKLRGRSLISSSFPQFIGLFVLSAFFWWIFEFINVVIQNWRYIGLDYFGPWEKLILTLSFSTVLPALFEIAELLKSVHLFENRTLKKYDISKDFLHFMMILGVMFFLATIILPKYAFPLVWGSFFFILDPVNYLHKQPSIIGCIKNGRLQTPLILLLAGIILGFFWEFWNYWAAVKWVYDVPFVGFFKIFEMPVLGYLGYFPFAFELYAMYWFTRSLFLKKEKLLSD